MKMTFKLPHPDHNPMEAWECLTGVGYVHDINPTTPYFLYTIEDKSPGEVMRRLDDVATQIRASYWWEDSARLNLFEQAQEQLDVLALGSVELSVSQVKQLSELLKRVKNNTLHLKPTPKDRALAQEVLDVLAKFEPLQVEEAV